MLRRIRAFNFRLKVSLLQITNGRRVHQFVKLLVKLRGVTHILYNKLLE